MIGDTYFPSNYIDIMGYNFCVRWSTAEYMSEYDALGLCDGDTLTIHISLAIDNKQILARVLMHEILRSINYVTVRAKAITECEDVERLGKALAIVVKDNIEWFEFIKELQG